MDLSRVFGNEQQQQQQQQAPQANAKWGAPAYDQTDAAPLGTNNQVVVAGDEHKAFQEAHQAATNMQDTVAQLQQQLAQLHNAAKVTKAAYSSVCAERDQLRSSVENAQKRLGDVQRVVARYAVVEEPVVASDGFTYEKRVIEKYLEDCREMKSEAISQQTKEVLTDTLRSNQSLRKLVDLLKTAKPELLGRLPEKNNLNSTTCKEVDAPADRIDKKPNEGRLHPCVRVYGFCNYKETCAYAQYPYDACLSHLKGKCRFGANCHEFHVDLKRPVEGNDRRERYERRDRGERRERDDRRGDREDREDRRKQ